MNWYYGNGTGTRTMMGWSNGFWLVGLLFEIVILVDLILVGIWLWKQINKGK